MSKTKKKIVQIISCMIPLKKWRKNFRAKYAEKKVQPVYEKTDISLMEFFYAQYNSDLSFNRYDMIVRLLAVENYYGLNDFGWKLYEKMQEKRKGQGYSKKAKEKFVDLIKSWEEKGYDDQSYLLVNGDIKLIDGSHRLALALYYNVKSLSLIVDKNGRTPLYGIDWFYENDFSLDEINLIKDRYEKLLEKQGRGVNISCVLWAPVSEYFDEVTQKINSLFPVKDIKDMEFSDDAYKRMVKAVYLIDDIADWKIEKKIEYMQNFPNKKIRFFDIYVEKPCFRFKQANLHTILVQGEMLKKIIRNCYKDKIENYFKDVIIHTADNCCQSEFIDALFKTENYALALLDNVRYIDEYKAYLLDKDIDLKKACIVGSSSFALYGILPNNDVDFCITNEELLKKYPDLIKTKKVAEHLELLLSKKYKRFFDISDEELINNKKYHVEIEGVKVIRPELEYVARLIMNRKKDKIGFKYIKAFCLLNPQRWNTVLIDELKTKANLND